MIARLTFVLLSLFLTINLSACASTARQPMPMVGAAYASRRPQTEMVTLHDAQGQAFEAPRSRICLPMGTPARPGMMRVEVEVAFDRTADQTYRVRLIGEQDQILTWGLIVSNGSSATCVLFVSRGTRVTGFQIAGVDRVN